MDATHPKRWASAHRSVLFNPRQPGQHQGTASTQPGGLLCGLSWWVMWSLVMHESRKSHGWVMRSLPDCYSQATVPGWLPGVLGQPRPAPLTPALNRVLMRRFTCSRYFWEYCSDASWYAAAQASQGGGGGFNRSLVQCHHFIAYDPSSQLPTIQRSDG